MMRDPETVADVLEELCEDYGLSPDQKIGTLIKACEDADLEDDLEYDEYDDDD